MSRVLGTFSGPVCPLRSQEDQRTKKKEWKKKEQSKKKEEFYRRKRRITRLGEQRSLCEPIAGP